MIQQKRIKCHQCESYFVTWDPKAPHGCRAMGFKSRELPSLVVKKSSGQPCLKYNRKAP